jgi:hypothetical protein
MLRAQIYDVEKSIAIRSRNRRRVVLRPSYDAGVMIPMIGR